MGQAPAVVARLNTEITRVLKMPNVIERLRNLGLEARAGTPAQLASVFGREITLYAKVIKDADIKSE